MKKQLILIIILLQLFLLNCQECGNLSQFYDSINKQCLDCNQSCRQCFGPSYNQCTQCNSNYYLSIQDSSCTQKCESNMQVDQQICIKCQIFGCKQCDQNNTCTQCFENMVLQNDGLCYQKQDICQSLQLYDYRQNQCVYSCQKNTIENYQQNICQNIINCNVINEYSNYQIKDSINLVFVSSSGSIVIVEQFCKISIADFNLQISEQFQLLPTSEFQQSQFQQLGDIIYCQSNINVALYDVVTEHLIKVPISKISNTINFISYFKIFNIMIFQRTVDYNIVIYSISSKNQITFNLGKNINFYVINNNLRLIYSVDSFKLEGSFFLVQLDGLVTKLDNRNFSCNFASIVNDDLKIFICGYSDKYEIHQIISSQNQLQTKLIQTIGSQNSQNIENIIYFYRKANIFLTQSQNSKSINIYAIYNNYSQSFLKFSYQSTDNYSFLIIQSNQAGQPDYLYLNQYFTNQNYYLPIDETLLNVSSFDQFLYKFDYPSDLTEISKFIYNKQLYFAFKFGQFQINMFIYNLEGQATTGQQVCSEGYTLELTYSYQDLSVYNSFVGKQDRYYFTNIFKSNIGFIQEQDMPLPFYQHTQQQKSIIFNKQVIGDQYQIIYLIKRVTNSDCLYVLMYQPQDYVQIIQIIDFCTQQTILKESVPFLMIEYIDSSLAKNFAELIIEYNYLIIYTYQILYDLTKKQIISSFSSQIQGVYSQTMWIFNGMILVVDNNLLLTQLFDLKTQTYQSLFNQQSTVYLVTENVENSKSVLFVDSYLYFNFYDQQKLKAFSLKLMSFSSYELTQQEFKLDLEKRIFQLSSNQLILFSQQNIVILSSDLQVISITPANNLYSQLINFYKSANRDCILFSSDQELIYYNLQIQSSQSIQIFDQNHNSYNLYFFGSSSSLVLKSKYLVHYLSMKIVKIFDLEFINFYSFFYPKKYASINTIIDTDNQQIVQSFNSENKPYISFPKSASFKIIYQNRKTYDAYFIDKNTYNIIKLNLLSQETTKFEINTNVDQIYIDDLLSAAIFTTYKNQIYDLNIIYLKQNQALQKIYSYNSILNFQICQSQQRAIIQTSFNVVYIVDYINNLQTKIELSSDKTQNLAQYKIFCDDNLIIQYTPNTVEYLIKEAVKNPVQYYVQYIDKFEFTPISPVFDLKKQSFIIYSKTNGLHSIYQGIKSSTYGIYFYDTTNLFLDPANNLLIGVDGTAKQIQVIDVLSLNQKYKIQLSSQVTQQNIYFDTDSNQLILLDLNPSIILYQYVTNQFVQKKLQYSQLQGFQVDLQKKYIFLYDNSYIYAHTYPDLVFLETILDHQNLNQQINLVYLDTRKNLLIVQNQVAINVYDLNQIVYTQSFNLPQSQEITYLSFDFDLYLVYNLRIRYLSLFQKSTFKYQYKLPSLYSTSKSLSYGQLLKTKSNTFIYQNLDYILFGQVDINNIQITKVAELTLQQSIRDIFYNSESNSLFLIEYITNDIYKIDLNQSLINQQLSIILNHSNQGLNLYYRGLINGNFLIYYSSGYIYSYDISGNQIKSSKLSQINDINLVLKLSFTNTNNINNYSSYTQNMYSSTNDNQQIIQILVVIQSESIIKILEATTLKEVSSINVQYNILNIHLEQERSLIYVVGDQGFTYVYTNKLEYKIQIINPCLLQTKVHTDEIYLYIYCESQLEIYNKFSVKKAFPTIYAFTNLNKIYYIHQQNLFIVVQHKIIQIVKIFQDQKQPVVVLFQKNQNLLQILNFSINIDSNNNKYLEIIAQGLLDIVQYVVSIDSISNKCSYSFKQSDSRQLNEFMQKQIQINLIYTNQLLQELQISMSNNQEIQTPPLLYNLNPEGVKVVYQSQLSDLDPQKQKSNVKLVDGSLFDNNLIQIVQINSINLVIPKEQQIVLNSQKNIKKLFLYDINILDMQAELVIQNLDLVHIKTIVFSKFNQSEINNMISIINCQTVIIEDVQILDSTFINGYIFQIVNSTFVNITGIKVISSIVDNFIVMNHVQQVLLKNLKIFSSNILKNFLQQQQNYNTTIQSIQCENIQGSTLINQIGCQYLTVDDFNISKTNQSEFSLLTTQEYLDIYYYKNILVQLFNLVFQESDNIILSISSSKIILKHIQLKKINQKVFSLIEVNAQEIEIYEFFCSFCNTIQQPLYLISIHDSKAIKLKNIQLEKSDISLIKMDNQIQSKVYLDDIRITGCQPQSSLVQIDYSIYLEIISSKFQLNECNQDGCVLLIRQVDTLVIRDSEFIGNISKQGKGGSIYLGDVDTTTIANVQFIKNKSLRDYGGALYYSREDNDISILKIQSESLFQNNSATKGKGGAIYLNKVNIQIEQSQIIQNEAAVGGGIFYEHYIPDIFLNQGYNYLQFIKENQAILYGKNIGSKLRAIEVDLSKIHGTQSSIQSENSLQIYDFQSGGYLSLLNVRLKDEEGSYLQFVSLNNLDINKNLVQEIENLNLQVITDSSILVQGSSISKYQVNGFNFNFSIISKPKMKNTFQIQSNILLDYLSYKSDIPLQEYVSYKIEVKFRSCNVGEIKVDFSNKIICEQCPDGKYSLSENDLSCKQCPSSAQQCIGSSIKLLPGYWRANNNTDEILVCSNNQHSCQPQKETSKFGCDKGFVGPLCETCDFQGNVWESRYSKAFLSLNCIECSGYIAIFILNFLIFFTFQFLYLTFSVYKIIEQSEKVLLGYYLKLLGILHLSNSVYNFQQPIFSQTLVDHIQVISVIDKYNLDLPQIFSFGTTSIGNPLQISNGSLDCFFPFKFIDGMEYWVFRFIISLGTPLSILLFLFCFQIITNGNKFYKSYLKFKITSVIYVYIFYFPSLVALISQALSCREIGSKKYASIDLNIECYDFKRHTRFILILVLPTIIFFIIIIPYWILKMIQILKKQKHFKFQLSKYQFLYEDYKPKYFYWYKIKMFFKSIIMTASILLLEQPNIRAFVVNITLISYSMISTRNSPYISYQRNQLEQQSIFISILTINLTFLYQGIKEVNSSASSYVTVVIYSLNGFFILKLVLLVFLEPIPADLSQQNFFQKILYKAKLRFPETFSFIKLIKKKSFSSIRKFNKIKQSIKQLAQLRQHQLQVFESRVQIQISSNWRVSSQKKNTNILPQIEPSPMKKLNKFNTFFPNSKNSQYNNQIKQKQSNQGISVNKTESFKFSQKDLSVFNDQLQSKEFLDVKEKQKVKFSHLNINITPNQSKEPEQCVFSPINKQFSTQNDFFITSSEKLKDQKFFDSQFQISNNNKNQKSFKKSLEIEQFNKVFSNSVIKPAKQITKPSQDHKDQISTTDNLQQNQIFSNNMLLDSQHLNDSVQKDNLSIKLEENTYSAQNVKANTFQTLTSHIKNVNK
ncbi:hypothetical protein ABPG74_001898 [Tetrahymena malaccensis]